MRVLGLVDLRQQVIKFGTVPTLVKKLEVGKHHEVRMSLLCLDILGAFGICLHLHNSIRYTREGKSAGARADCNRQRDLLEAQKERASKESCQGSCRIGSDV